MKKGGGGRETRLGSAALEKQGRAEMKSTIPRVSPPGSKSSSSACVLRGLGQVMQPRCASAASSTQKTLGLHRGIILFLLLLLLARGRVTEPSWQARHPPPPTRQSLTAWGPLHRGTHHDEVRCELRDPQCPARVLES